MNKKLIYLLLSSTLLISCSNEKTETKEVEVTTEEEMTEKKERTVELPEESKEMAEFPWEAKEDFQNIQKENNTDVLIAGYATVFKSFTLEESENIRLAAEAINGSIVNPGEVFSQNETAGPYTEERGYKEGIGYVNGEAVKDFGGGVCKVATTLYNTAIASNLEIIERYNHSMPVPYVPYGQDAAVAYGHKDFRFENTTENPMLIWSEFIDNRLYMAFYGQEAAPEITWEHETLSENKSTTEYRTNNELDESEENILVHGMDGKVVHSILRIKDENGEETIKDLGQSSYAPLKTTIEINE